MAGPPARRCSPRPTTPPGYIGLHERLGSLEVGKSADLLLLDAPIEHLPYRLGHNPVLAVFREGELIYARADTAARFDV